MGSEVIDLLQQLIRNACVNTASRDSGHEHKSVATLQDFFGVPGEVFEPSPGRQSLVYRIAGTDPDAPSLALVPHLDVVPAHPDDWTQDPFGADIVDGFVYGRGAVDMLNITAAFAHAVRPYLRGELRPTGDLGFARHSHSATHLTISANLARAGTKSNTIADRASAVLDIRPLPGMDREFVDTHLAEAVGSTQNQVGIKSLGSYDPTTSATGGPLWDAITQSVEDTEGHRNLLPTLMTVASDARFWRRRGTTAYGVGLYDEATSFSDLLSRFHGHDERVSIESVERTAALYERILHHFRPR